MNDTGPDVSHEPAPPGRAALAAIAFTTGFAVMTVEIAGARLIAPVYGLSTVPWTAVIGVILAALAAGNRAGGRWADAGRIPLANVLAVAGFAALIPILGYRIPAWTAQQFGFVGGAVVASVLLFAPPVFALGTAVPYLVRARAAGMDVVGRAAGDVSAAATVGSIAGTFTTGFVLLPLVSLPTLVGLTAGVLFGLAAFTSRVLGRPGPAPGALLLGLVLAVGAAALRPARGDVLLARETIHGSIRVTEREWADGRFVRELWQNAGSSSAEVVGTGAPAHAYAATSLSLLAGVAGLDSALVLGGGALTLPVALAEARPGLSVDVVELDPVVSELASTYFRYGETPARDRIRVIHRDVRVYLGESGRRYDLVYLDVFDHLVTVPWTLVTAEAFVAMRDRLRPDGIWMANVLSPLEGDAAAFLRRLLGTLEVVFPVVRAYAVTPDLDGRATQNVIVVAATSASALPPTATLRLVLPPEGPPFTDWYAPVEALQARVFLEGLRWR